MQVFIEINIGPGIAEIGHPGYPGDGMDLFRNEMHAVRRAGGHNGIDGVIPEIFFQEAHRWFDPEFARIGDEEIAANENW